MPVNNNVFNGGNKPIETNSAAPAAARHSTEASESQPCPAAMHRAKMRPATARPARGNQGRYSFGRTTRPQT